MIVLVLFLVVPVIFHMALRPSLRRGALRRLYQSNNREES